MSRRLVVVSNRRLDEIRSGSAAYLMRTLHEAAAAGFDVRFVMAPETAFGSRPWCVLDPEVAAFATMWPRAVRLGRAFLSLSPRVWVRFVRRLAIEAARRLGLPGGDARVGSLLSHIPRDAEKAIIVRAVRSAAPDAALVEYSSLGPVLADLPETAVRAVLMHDLFSSRAASFRGASTHLDHLDITLEAEAARLVGANIILHASMNELGAMAPLLPQARHVWLRPLAPLHPEWLKDQPPACIFMGADHAGNREALDHLLGEIWPRIRAQAPQATLLIVGAVGAAIAEPPPGVTILGRIDDLSRIAGPDMIGLAPVRVGSGVAIKVADYLGAGMPVVGYPGGLDGFGDVLDAVVYRVPDVAAFAAAVAALLSDAPLRRARSAAGLDIAARLLGASGLIDALAATSGAPAEARPQD